MKTRLFLFAAAVGALALASCGGDHSVSGKFAGLGDGTVIVEYVPINRQAAPVQDTLQAKGGKFNYDIASADTVALYIHFPGTGRTLTSGQPYESMQLVVMAIMKPGEKIALKGSVEDPDFVSYTAGGTGFNADFAQQREAMRELAVRGDSIDRTAIELEQGAEGDPEQQAFIQDMMDEYSAIAGQLDDMRLEYVKANPDTDLAANYAVMQPVDKFGEWYALLGENAKNGLFAATLANRNARYEAYKIRMEAAQNVEPGAQAPEFTLTSIDGKQVSLASVKGECIVLDFWGSWCGWCIKGFPEMKKYHEKYPKRLTIVGIACRDTEEAWRKAVETHKLPWLQLINDQSGELSKDVSAIYAVQGYPTKVILDKDHKIVRVVVGEDPAFYKKLDELLKK
ncbi:MAG: AhpC/TSA family protein [Rikenellaceae bacterium]|jgi:peroxiredoxin|nr:AhpC/TSA family protein [Rikenellaceae bacterium]